MTSIVPYSTRKRQMEQVIILLHAKQAGYIHPRTKECFEILPKTKYTCISSDSAQLGS